MLQDKKMALSGENTANQIPAYDAPSFALVWSNFKDWIKFLIRKWYFLLPVVLISMGIGVVYAWVTKPKFESRVSFALEENNSGLGGAINLAAEFGFNIGGSSSIFSGDNILQIITSRRVIENVLLSIDTSSEGQIRTMAQYMLDLSKDSGKKFDNAKERIAMVSFPAGKERSKYSYLEDSVLYIIYEEIILPNLVAHRPDKKLGIFEVRFISTEERFSKIFTERLIKETTDFYTELRSKKSRQTLEILQSRVNALRGNVSMAIGGRTAIQDANLNPAFAAAQAPLQEKQVDLSAYSGAYAELFKNLELARYQYLQDVPLLQVIDRADYPLKKIKKGRLFMGLLFGTLAGIISMIILTGVYLIEKQKG
jgi:hypothetical protein